MVKLVFTCDGENTLISIQRVINQWQRRGASPHLRVGGAKGGAPGLRTGAGRSLRHSTAAAVETTGALVLQPAWRRSP